MDNSNNKSELDLKKATNKELEDSFQRLNMYYFASDNLVTQELLFNSMQSLQTEITRRDRSLVHQLSQYMITIKSQVKGLTSNGRATKSNTNNN